MSRLSSPCFFLHNIFVDSLGVWYHAPQSQSLPVSPYLPALGPLPGSQRSKDKSNFKRRKEKISLFCVIYLTGAWSKFLVAGPLNRTESFPSHTDLFPPSLVYHRAP